MHETLSDMNPPERHEIRAALPQDLTQLARIEAAADSVFATVGIGPLPPPCDDPAGLAPARALLVAGRPPYGFARVDEVDGAAHLEQLSVHPDHARRGAGRALLLATVDWAAANGYSSVTLCTFADVAWNAPFYARHGFAECVDLGPGLQALRATERRLGLDDLGRRVVMRRPAAP